MFNFKKKVKNKAYVKDLICKAYIDEEISLFILYYFKPYFKTKINCIPKYDDKWGSAFEWEFIDIFLSWITFTKKYNERKILELSFFKSSS